MEPEQTETTNTDTVPQGPIGSSPQPVPSPILPKKHSKVRKFVILILIILVLAAVFWGVVFGLNYFYGKKVSKDITKTAANGYFEIPKDISKEQALNPTKQQASEIFKQISKSINVSPEVNKNDIVVNLTKDGEVISPNIEKMKQSASDDVVYADTENNNTYVVADPPDNTFETWTDAEKASLKDTIAKAYALNKEILGAPAFNDTVYIYKQDTRGYYSPWGTNGTKSIVLSDDTPDVLAHEMSHSFRSDYVFVNPAWEEGLAMLSEDQYCERYLNSRARITISSGAYIDINQPIVSTPYFYSDSCGLIGVIEPVTENEHYSMAGFAMEKVYVENPEYIKKFVQNYFTADRNNGENGNVSENKVRNVFTSAVPSIEGKDSSSWLYSNYILIPSFNESQRLAYIENSVDFLQRGESGYTTTPYKNATITEQVSTLDNTQVLNQKIVTDDNGFAYGSLFGKVPKTDFYKVVLDAESQDGAVAHQGYIEYIAKDKLENEEGCATNCIYGPTKSNAEITATDPDGNKLVGKISGYYFKIEGIKQMTKYTISQGGKKITEDVVGASELTMGLLDDTTITKGVSVQWETPSDPEPTNNDPKFKPTLVFSNNSVDYDKPYITICAAIDGGYFADSVTINDKVPTINKGEFCMPFDLKDGANDFTIKVTPTSGAVVTSKRTINKIGTTTGSYTDLDDIGGYFTITNDSTNSSLAKMDIQVYLSSNKAGNVAKNVYYGVNINGPYYKPGLDPHDASPTASFFKIDELKADVGLGIDNSYTSSLDLNLAEYPFIKGTNKVCLIVDLLQTVEESNEDNNTTCQSIEVQ